MGEPRGKFINYHTATLVAEMADIPSPDLGLLFSAMDHYADGDDAGFTLKSYGGGILMLKRYRRNGRLLFSHDGETGPRPVALLAYKKESDDAPSHLLNTARERRGKYIEARRRSR